MLIAAIEPLLNPVWVYLFSGEKPGGWSIIGGAIIITAVTFSSVLSYKKPQEVFLPGYE
jgi:drug/metabolite transporter (DMT)-like permease